MKRDNVISASVAEPRHVVPEGIYDGRELRPYQGRPGAMDAFNLPSRMGNRLHYRDGDVKRVEDAS